MIPTQSVTIYLPKEMVTQLDAMANRSMTSRATVIRLILQRGIMEDKQPIVR